MATGRLSLRRKVGEEIVIPSSAGLVRVRVEEADRGRVQLVFVAPVEVGIFRREVYESIHKVALPAFPAAKTG